MPLGIPTLVQSPPCIWTGLMIQKIHKWHCVTSEAKSQETSPLTHGSLRTLSLGMFLLRTQLSCWEKPTAHGEATGRHSREQPTPSASHEWASVDIQPSRALRWLLPQPVWLQQATAPTWGPPSWAQLTHRPSKIIKCQFHLGNVLDEPIKTNLLNLDPWVQSFKYSALQNRNYTKKHLCECLSYKLN